MNNSKVYKYCAVPMCQNNSLKTPRKLFVYIPKKKELRNLWFRLANRVKAPKSKNIYYCEDHFDLPNDMKNYMEYHVMGTVSSIRLKRNCVPTKFLCQSDSKRIQPGSGNSSETDDLEYISVDSGEENENVTNQDVKEESLTIENHELTDVEVVENNPIKSEFTNDNISQFVKEEIKESISSKPFVNNICFSKFKNEEIQKISEESRSPHNLPEVKEELVDEIDSFDSGSGDCIPSGHWIEIKEELIEEESVVDCLVKREEDKPLEVQNLFC